MQGRDADDQTDPEHLLALVNPGMQPFRRGFSQAMHSVLMPPL
jgi:hypothetical protein